MLSRTLLAAACWLAAALGAPAGADPNNADTGLTDTGGAIGFRETTVIGAPMRQIHLATWFPTQSQDARQMIGDNPAFQGTPMVRYAAPDQDLRPLVVLSHGYGGSWRNLNWLAARLAHQGYIVVAPDHPGTTTFDRNPRQASMGWLRPRDLSLAIDAVLADPALAGRADPGRIAAIGHSLGGWSVTALAGARFDPDLFADDCARAPNPTTCGLTAELGLDQPEIAQDLADPRLRAFVSLDLGLARGFTPESLGGIGIPGLILAAGTDSVNLSAATESGYLAEHLPETASYTVIPDASHFSFMQQCKPGAEARIEADTPGESFVCQDGGQRSRAQLHDEIAQRISAFLAKSL